MNRPLTDSPVTESRDPVTTWYAILLDASVKHLALAGRVVFDRCSRLGVGGGAFEWTEVLGDETMIKGTLGSR